MQGRQQFAGITGSRLCCVEICWVASHCITLPPISRRTVSARLKGPLLMTGQNETLDGVLPRENSPLLASRDPSHKANLPWSLQHEATHGTMGVLRWSRVLRTEYTALTPSSQSGPQEASLNVGGRQMMPNPISVRRRVPPAVQISPSHRGQTRLARLGSRCTSALYLRRVDIDASELAAVFPAHQRTPFCQVTASVGKTETKTSSTSASRAEHLPCRVEQRLPPLASFQRLSRLAEPVAQTHLKSPRFCHTLDVARGRPRAAVELRPHIGRSPTPNGFAPRFSRHRVKWFCLFRGCEESSGGPA